MNFYVNYCIGMTAFWIVQSSGIRMVYQVISEILSGTLIPLIFFSEALQKMLFSCLFSILRMCQLVWLCENTHWVELLWRLVKL